MGSRGGFNGGIGNTGKYYYYKYKGLKLGYIKYISGLKVTIPWVTFTKLGIFERLYKKVLFNF